MSRIITTSLGRFNIVANHSPLFECECGEWMTLSEAQANGLVSVDHDSMGCSKRYHETHNYLAALKARVAVARINNEDPFDPDLIVGAEL